MITFLKSPMNGIISRIGFMTGECGGGKVLKNEIDHMLLIVEAE